MHAKCDRKAKGWGSASASHTRPTTHLSERNSAGIHRAPPRAEAGECNDIIVLEHHRMYRLPQCDRNGGLLERAAFLALNAGALLLVGIVLLDGARFSAGREEITRALSTEVKSLSPEPSGVAQQP